MAIPRFIDVGSLSRRAADLFAARNVLRLREWYFKACKDAPAARLFMKAVGELNSSVPDAGVLRGLARRADIALERYGYSLQRGPLVRLASVCMAKASERALASRGGLMQHDLHWLDKKRAKVDVDLWLRSEHADFKALTDTGSPAKTLTALGPLWIPASPSWLDARWPSQRELEKNSRAELGLDDPEYVPRGASLVAASERLPEALSEILCEGNVLLHYSATRETTIRKAQPGVFSVSMSKPRKPRLTAEFPANHRFRRPASDVLYEAFRARLGGSPRLKPLRALYAEHDGGLLFRPEGARAEHSHVDILGLRDQASAMRSLVHDVRSVSNEGERRVEKLFDDLHCERETCFIFMAAGVSMFVVPLLGMHQGRVFRVAARAGYVKPWAENPIDGLRRVARELPKLCVRTPLLMQLDEDRPDVYAELRLTRVTDLSPND